jgi:hypothetical protein
MRLPGVNHFKALIHLLHHIRCNLKCGTTYYANVVDAPVSKLIYNQNIDPTTSAFYAFADSSWQDCPDTGRSTGGYYIFFQGGIVDAAMTFPVPVSLSSAEAEYCNASLACVSINAMAMLINELSGLDPDLPLDIPLLIDNKACIAMGEAFKDSKHNRHILRRYHYVRWMSSEERVNLLWVSSDVQLADVATKNLDGSATTLTLFRSIAETPVQL